MSDNPLNVIAGNTGLSEIIRQRVSTFEWLWATAETDSLVTDIGSLAAQGQSPNPTAKPGLSLLHFALERRLARDCPPNWLLDPSTASHSIGLLRVCFKTPPKHPRDDRAAIQA